MVSELSVLRPESMDEMEQQIMLEMSEKLEEQKQSTEDLKSQIEQLVQSQERFIQSQAKMIQSLENLETMMPRFFSQTSIPPRPPSQPPDPPDFNKSNLKFDGTLSELLSLKQCGDSVETYLEKFDCALSRLSLSMPYAVNIFLSNMNPHLASRVKQFDVTTVAYAAWLAKLFESSLLHTSAIHPRAPFSPNQNPEEESRPEVASTNKADLDFGEETFISNASKSSQVPSQESLYHIYHLPVFDGTLLDCWIAKMDRFFELKQYGNEEKLDLISLCLEGAALKWFRKHRREFTDWTYIKRKLMARFGLVKGCSPPEVLPKEKLITKVDQDTESFDVREPSEVTVEETIDKSMDMIREERSTENESSPEVSPQILLSQFQVSLYSLEPGGILIEHDKWKGLEKCYKHGRLMSLMHWLSSMWWKESKSREFDRLSACSCVDLKTWYCVKHETQQTDFHVWHRWKNKAEKLPATYALLELMMLGLLSFQPNKGNDVVGLVPKAIELREFSHCRSNEYGTNRHELFLVRDTSCDMYKEDSWSFIWIIFKELCSAGCERENETIKKSFKGLSKVEKDHKIEATVLVFLGHTFSKITSGWIKDQKQGAIYEWSLFLQMLQTVKDRKNTNGVIIQVMVQRQWETFVMMLLTIAESLILLSDQFIFAENKGIEISISCCYGTSSVDMQFSTSFEIMSKQQHFIQLPNLPWESSHADADGILPKMEVFSKPSTQNKSVTKILTQWKEHPPDQFYMALNGRNSISHS